jgi:uncharacterized membrane protein YbaN (DUF454 family)
MGCVVLGGIGLAVPGLPGTVFFIAAAAAFARSSPRLERWLLDLRVVGPLVRDHRAGLGMPRRAKVVAVTMIVVSVGISALVLERPLVRIVVVVLGAVGVAAVLRVRGRPPDHGAP